MPLAIGILQTDEVLAQYRDRHGDYPSMFTQLFQSVDGDVTTETFWVQDPAALPDSVDCDAYVITGSRHSVYEELPWIAPLVEFVRKAIDAERKVIGVCFGHQLMAHFFGGRVEAAEQGWAVGVHESSVVADANWMAGDARERFALISSHKDQVQALPPGAELFATNDFCPVAGFTMGDSVMTVQGHPEFAKAYSEDLMNMRRELLGEETFTRGVASLEKATDETLLANWMLSFIRGSAA